MTDTETYERLRKQDIAILSVEQLAQQTLLGVYNDHFAGAHGREWLALQMKRAERYGSIYGTDLPECAVCVAYGTALKGLEEAEEERKEAELADDKARKEAVESPL